MMDESDGTAATTVPLYTVCFAHTDFLFTLPERVRERFLYWHLDSFLQSALFFEWQGEALRLGRFDGFLLDNFDGFLQ